MPVVHTVRQVVLLEILVPPPQHEITTDSANEIYYVQFFDGYAGLQEHGHDVHLLQTVLLERTTSIIT